MARITKVFVQFLFASIAFLATECSNGYGDSEALKHYAFSDYVYYDDTSVKACPSFYQVLMYLGAGVYFDEGDVFENGFQTFKVYGKEYHQGYWLKKRNKIEGFADNTAYMVSEDSWTFCPRITKSNAASVRLSGDYFFLPSTGYSYDGMLCHENEGFYWISDNDNADFVRCLYFSSDGKTKLIVRSNNVPGLTWKSE